MANLTKKNIKEAAKEVLEPYAEAIQKDFTKIDECFDKTATKDQITDLIAKMATREEMEELKGEVGGITERVDNLTNLIENKVIKGIERLETEKTVRDYQVGQERKWRGVVSKALVRHKIITPKQFEKSVKSGVID